MEKNPEVERSIQYAPDLERATSRPELTRQRSMGSLSRRSSFSARMTVDPDVILPIEYRTL